MDDNAIFCSKCGARANGDAPNTGYNPYSRYESTSYYPAYDNEESLLIAIASFLFREIGLVLWFLWRHTRPGKARSAAKGALASVSLSMPVLGAILWLVWRDEHDRRDYAKACGICAIIGGIIYVLGIITMTVLYLTGVVDSGFYTSLPINEIAMAIFGIR